MDARKQAVDRATSIIADGLDLAARRFSQFPALSHILTQTRLVAAADTPAGIAVDPPGQSDPSGVVRFDPEHILELAEEHAHPKWVVCARLERLILADCERWGCDEGER